MPIARILACLPGMVWERWLRETASPSLAFETVLPEDITSALQDTPFAGAVLLLCPGVLARWDVVRFRLVKHDIPLVALTFLAVEPLRRLALDRELRLVGLHVIGFDDHPAHLGASLNRLLADGVLQRFLRNFGLGVRPLERLIAPVWESLATTRSVEEWAALLGSDGEHLRRELRGLGVRCPKRLLTWLRLLAAWPPLQAGAAAGVVATAVGYSAPPALTRSARHFVGVVPSAASKVPLDELLACATVDVVTSAGSLILPARNR